MPSQPLHRASARSASPPRPGLPLASRLPNPPALFHGRAAEAAFLRDAIPRAPVTVVAGDGGLGKSALTLFVLHDAFPERVASTLFVSLRGGDPLEPLALTVARALVRAEGPARFDWSELLGAPDALATLAIDLADAQSRWVVLDDLHHGDPEQVRSLLQQVSRYARASRWIATVRAAPAADELAGRVLRLGAMEAADLHQLAAALSPSSRPDEIAAAVQRAEGSPWRLRHGSVATPGTGPLTPAELVRGLSAETLDFLKALSVIAIPVPEPLLAEIAPRPSEPLAVLEERALVERAAEGVRLHERTRALVPAPDRSPRGQAFRARAGAALAASTDAAPALAGVRLLLDASAEQGARAAAASALAVAGEALLDAGYAAALWGLLEPAAPVLAETSPDAELVLERWRLTCAAQLGDAHVLARVRPPEGDAPELRFLWARLLAMKGELDAAHAIAEEAQLDAAAAGDAQTVCDAAVLRVRCLANLWRPAEALAVANAITAPDPLRAAKAEAVRAPVLVDSGQPEAALACAAALAAKLPELPWPMRGEIGQRVAHVLYDLGHLREAAAAFEQTVAGEQRGSARFDAGRMLRHVHCCVLTDAGDLERARRELDALEPYLGRGPGSLLRDYFVITRAHAALASGYLDEVEHHCAELESHPVTPQVAAEVVAIRCGALVLARQPPDAERAPFAAPPQPEDDRPRIARVQLALRSGHLSPEATLAALAAPVRDPEMRVAARIATAEARLLAGDADAAIADATAAVTLASHHGYGVREAEARQLLCDALVVAGRDAALAAAAAELTRLTATFDSPRFTRAATLCRALAEAGPPDPAILEALAAADPPLDAGSRARSLLSGVPASDALDRRVLDAVVRRCSFRAPARIGSEATSVARWTPAWGIDEPRTRVWLPDGRTVDLSRHPVQWALLRCLAAHGGAASKETLTLEVWSERDYHPLRHDNRLQAAVRKLRLQIEDDPAAPSRFVTTGDGYALSGPVRSVPVTPR